MLRSRPITARLQHPSRQRGMVTLVVMLFLIATVVFALSQMLNISGGNVVDGQRQNDSTAALFLAESGVEKAQASVTVAITGGGFTNETCTNLANSFNLGRGSVSVVTTSTPTICSSGTTPCALCTVTSVGQVGASQRTVTQDLVLTIANGVYCTSNCTNTPTVTWQLSLKNSSGMPGIGLFNLAYVPQGNNNATCAAGSNCVPQLALDTGNGSKAAAMQGNAVLIPNNNTWPIYQTTNKDQPLAEVGVFFLGTNAALTGPATPGGASYWGSNITTGSGGTTGSTNDGTATAAGACDAPSAGSQSCTDWCYGGDTLAASFVGDVSKMGDKVATLTFGTEVGTGQNIAMTPVVKYPDSTNPNASTPVDAEIWYHSNPNFSGTSPVADHVSSYKALGSGAIGAKWTSSSDTTAINTTTLTVGNSFNSFTVWPAQMINVGDVLSSAGGAAGGDVNCTGGCPTIIAQLSSTETGGMATGLGGRGTYQLSKSQTLTARNGRVWTISSTVLHTTACWLCNFAVNDPLAGLITGPTIQIQAPTSNAYGLPETTGGVGRYTISGAATQATWGDVAAGTPSGGTLYLPTGSSQPVLTNPAMLVAKKTGTGILPTGTTVTAVNAPLNGTTNVFTVSATPTPWLINASVCGGTCAFFNHAGPTSFSFTKAVGTTMNNWALGFTCMKGIEQVPQVVITDANVLNRRWTEPVQ